MTMTQEESPRSLAFAPFLRSLPSLAWLAPTTPALRWLLAPSRAASPSGIFSMVIDFILSTSVQRSRK